MALPKDLDGHGERQTHTFTKDLADTLESTQLWDEYGVDNDITVNSIFCHPCKTH